MRLLLIFFVHIFPISTLFVRFFHYFHFGSFDFSTLCCFYLLFFERSAELTKQLLFLLVAQSCLLGFSYWCGFRCLLGIYDVLSEVIFELVVKVCIFARILLNQLVLGVMSWFITQWINYIDCLILLCILQLFSGQSFRFLSKSLFLLSYFLSLSLSLSLSLFFLLSLDLNFSL